jgi:MarR family transcriptional regulator, organic hydroperoxide resistance regulator
MQNRSERVALQAAITSFFNASALLDAMRLRIWDREGLTVTQLRMLVFLSEEEGLSNADLADRLLVTRPSVSALLERLERGGFIRREVASHDRRGIRIWLEPRGHNAVSTLRAEVREYAMDLMEDLSDDDLEEIRACLDKLVASGRAQRARALQTEAKSEEE